MHFYPTERIALFVDGANLYATAKALGFDIDYKRLLTLFRGLGLLVRAQYYTALAEDQEYSSIRPLVDWLDYNGYTMVTKPTKEFTDSFGRRKIKGNMDIELTVDAMRLVDHLDHVVLFTGDGDFRALVAALQLKGRRVSIVSTLQTQPPMVADELRRQADQFIDLAELEEQILPRPGLAARARAARARPASCVTGPPYYASGSDAELSRRRGREPLRARGSARPRSSDGFPAHACPCLNVQPRHPAIVRCARVLLRFGRSIAIASQLGSMGRSPPSGRRTPATRVS